MRVTYIRVSVLMITAMAIMAPSQRVTALETVTTTYAAGDFETVGLTPQGWSVSATSPNRAIVTRARGISGTRSLQVEDTSTSQAVSVRRKVAVSAGASYSLEGYAYTYSGVQSLTLTFLDSTGMSLGGATVKSTDARMVWSRVELKATAPAGATGAEIRIASANATTSTVFWDAIALLRTGLFNGGFETAPTSTSPVPAWTAGVSGGATASLTTSTVHSGKRALLLNDNSTTGLAAATSTQLPISAGVAHDLSLWVKPSSGSIMVVVRWYNASRSVIQTRSYTVAKPVGAWSAYRQPVTAPYNAAYLSVQLATTSGGKASVVIDDVDLRPSAPAPNPSYSKGSMGTPVDGLANSVVSGVTIIKGRTKLYTVISGSPARFELLDVESGNVEVNLPAAGINTGWGVTVGRDGAIYFTGGGAHLWRYRPGATGLDDLGRATPKASTGWDLETGPDGRIWGVSYPGSELWSFDPTTKAFANIGTLSTAHDYARSVAVDSRYAYVGLGSTKPTLMRVDLGAPSNRTTIALPAAVEDGNISELEVLGRFLMVRTPSGTSASGSPVSSERRLYDLTARTWNVPANLNVQTPTNLDANGAFYYVSARQIYRVDSQTGVKTIVASTTFGPARDRFVLQTTLGGVNAKWVLMYDPSADRVNAVNLATMQERTYTAHFAPAPLRIKSIDAGPNGTLYVGGFGGPSLAVLNPATRANVQHPSTSAGSVIGEVEGSIAHGQYQYLGTYNGGKIWRYDTTKPWVDGGQNPSLIASLGSGFSQDRPLAWATSGTRVFAGTVPNYGVLGGALVIIDSDTSSPRVVREPVKAQSVVSLAAQGNVVYGGTSRWGGLGIAPTQASGKVFAYDAASNRKLWESTPLAGVNAYGAMAFGPNNSLWAAAGPMLFELDKKTGAVLRKVMVYPAQETTGSVTRNADLIYQDGLFYLSAGQRLYTVDPYTLRVSNPVPSGVTANPIAAVGQRIYYSVEDELRFVTITKTVPTAPTAVAALAGDRSARISWVTPSANGGAPVTRYTVTASPGGATASTTSTTLTMQGLANGTSYTFRVRAANALGTSAASSPSTPVTPRAPTASPARLTPITGSGLTPLTGSGLKRVAGADRYATAVLASKQTFPAPQRTVFVASGENYPDALAGGPIAARMQAPILLVGKETIPVGVQSELGRLRPTKIYVLGGAGAVSDRVKSQLAALTGASVTRAAGSDRYATAATTAKLLGVPRTVYLASGEGFADALAGGAAAAKQSASILLTQVSSLPSATRQALSSMKPSRVVVLGGPGAVSRTVISQIRSTLPSASVSVFAGSDRFDTAARLAKSVWPAGSRTVFHAPGASFPDALAGTPGAYVSAAPVMLTRSTCTPKATANAVKSLKPSLQVALGGTGVTYLGTRVCSG